MDQSEIVEVTKSLEGEGDPEQQPVLPEKGSVNIKKMLVTWLENMGVILNPKVMIWILDMPTNVQTNGTNSKQRRTERRKMALKAATKILNVSDSGNVSVDEQRNTASPKILERGEPPGLKNVFSQNKALRFLHKAEAKSKVNDAFWNFNNI